MGRPTPLAPQSLYTACDPASLPFNDPTALPEIDAALIHTRAVEAMRMGLDIPHSGYNLFVLGETGSGRHAIINQLLEGERRSGEPPVRPPTLSTSGLPSTISFAGCLA